MPTPPRADAAFILGHTRLVPVPLVPDIRLHLAGDATTLWRLWEGAEADPPIPFWAFAWAGGQALARYLLDHPETVAGRRVIDFGSGSGLVAIAASMAGASEVRAAEIDRFADVAIALNADANGVEIARTRIDLEGAPPETDLLLAGDVFYEKGLAETALPFLLRCREAGLPVLIGDPGRPHLPKDLLVPVAEYDVSGTAELEDAPVKRAAVWTFRDP